MDKKFVVNINNKPISYNIEDNSLSGTVRTSSGLYYIDFGIAMVDSHNHNNIYYTKQEIDDILTNSGLMYRAVYDINNNGVVDISESVYWSGIIDKPSVFAPEPHTHTTSDLVDHNKSTHDVLMIDADTVDGKHASDFAEAIHHHDDRYYTETEIDNLIQNLDIGDMYKAVYDTNNDGVVDAAESVPWGGITGKPSAFPPESHIHPLSDISDHTKAAHDALGIDADTVDGKHASDFANAIHHHDDRYYTEAEIDVLLQNVGTGDMLKSVYDTNNNGVVDAAEAVDWSGVQNKPTSFPPSAHTHLLSDVLGHDKAAHDSLGINADTVDNKHASDFADAVHHHDDRYYTESEIDAMLQNVGGGDMYKSVYDTDNDGVVDAAESVPWNGITDKPTSFPPSSHTHPLSDITGHDKATHDALNINADTLDGQHASAFAQASHTHTPDEVGLGNVTNDAQLKRAGNDFTGFTEKTTPADNDLILSEDSAASYAKKKITLGNIYLWFKGRFDSLYAALSHNHDASYYTKTQLNTSGAGGAVHWDNVTSKPSTYPPSTHQHAASDVTSGVFDTARIPNLDASKITSGTLSTDRFSAYADLQAESKLNWVTGGLATVSGVRYEWKNGNPSNDFTTASIPSGFYWAGSPFVTPSLSSHGGSYLGVYVSSAPSKAFLVADGTPTGNNKYLFGVIADIVNVRNVSYIGFRLDDGTDQNYCELALSSYSDFFNYEVISVVCSNGNVTITSAGVLPRQAMARMELRPPFSTPELVCFTQVRVGSIKPTISFTPARVGIIFNFYATWERYYIDGIGGTWP